MTDHPASSKKSNRFLRIFFISLTVLFVILLFIISTLSWTVPPGASAWLKSQGYQLDIGKTSINLFKGQAVVKELLISAAPVASTDANELADPSPNSDSTPLSIGSIAIKTSIWDLLTKQQLTLENFNVTDVTIPIQTDGEAYWMAGIAIPLSSAETAEGSKLAEGSDPASSAENNSEKTDKSESHTLSTSAEESTSPLVRWTSVAIDKLSIHLSHTNTAVEPLSLNFTQVAMGAFDSQTPQQASPFNLAFEAKDTALNIQGESTLLQTISGQASLELIDLNTALIEHLTAFAPTSLDIQAQMPAIEANLNYQSDLSWSIGEAVALSSLANQLALNNVNFNNSTEQGSQTILANIAADAKQINYSADSGVTVEAFTLNNSELTYQEQIGQQRAEINVHDIQFTLDSLQTDSPQHSSQLDLTAKIGEFGSLNLKGQSTLLNFKDNTHLTVDSSQIDLLDISMYAESTINRRIESGQFSNQSQITIEQSQLKAINDLRLDQFRLDTANADDQSKQDPLELGMPLNTALSLLRDSNDRIELTLPIDGSVDDPSFNIKPTLNKALFKSIKTAVITQVGPLLAISALGKVKDFSDALQLKKISFEHGSTTLSQASLATTEKLGDFLKQKENISIRLCPSYSSLDNKQPLDNEKTLEKQAKTENQATETGLNNGEYLSQERINQIKSALLASGIEGQRIVPCAAKLIDNPDELPSVKPSF